MINRGVRRVAVIDTESSNRVEGMISETEVCLCRLAELTRHSLIALVSLLAVFCSARMIYLYARCNAWVMLLLLVLLL